MRLTPGNPAPDFEIQDLEGRTLSLAQYRGKPLLLQFYRFASCPMCDLRLHDFSQAYPRLKDRGLEVAAFFHSSAKRLRGHFRHHPLPFSIAADPARQVYRRYGIETSWMGLLLTMLRPQFYWDWVRSMRYGYWGGMDWQLASMPADFLIGPDGTILHVHYGRTIGDHMPIHQIEQALTALPPARAPA
jgi:peroxiredoxin